LAGYKPKYRQPGTGRPGLLSRFRSAVAGILQRTGQSRGVPQQAAVIDYQQKYRFRKLSRTGTLFLLLAAILSAGGWFCYQALERSDIFRLTTVSIQGNRMTRQAQILDLGSIEQGVNLLSFDVGLAEERISRHSWIDRVEIARSWPSTLKVRVYEHRPLAMVNIEKEEGRSLYYVDHQGKVYALVDDSQDLDFPVITGVQSTGDLTGTMIGDKGLVAQAFQFLRLAAGGNPIVPLQTISEVNVSPEKGIVVYLVDHPFPIYMGYDNINTRYSQLVKLLERLYRKKKVQEIKEIRMDYQEGRILVAKVES